MNSLLDMNPSRPECESDESPQRDLRYTYASGARPLDGYVIKRGVGRGGFGEVYFAVSDAGKEVALKLIRRNLEVELRGVTQCLNLKHPNLIDLYDVRVDANDDRWVVMEYVSGASLEDVIDRYPDGMPLDMALHWFHGICAAVAYLHDHGIVHRDLKPANIFLDRGQVKIGDYGLSKFISCSRRSGQTESVGTVHYMAPEIANGRYGKEIDTYALGIILFEMLTGRVPFEGESVGEVLMKHLTAEPDLSAIAEPFRTAVQRALAKDPERRVQNVGDLLALLEVRETPVGGAPPMFDAAYRAPAGAEGPAAALGGDRSPFGRSFARDAAERVLYDEEPIAAAVRQLGRRFQEEVQATASWPPLARGLAGFGLTVGLILTAGAWLPLLMTAGMAYLAYRVVRAAYLHLSGATATRRPRTTPRWAAQTLASGPPQRPPFAAPPQAPAPPAPPASPARPNDSPEGIARPWRRRQHATWQNALRAHLAARSVQERCRETAGSMVLIALVSTLGALLLNLLAAPTLRADLIQWTAIVATLAGWAILLPAKLAETHVEDQAPLRFAMLLLGALVGCAAWALAQYLLLPLPLLRDMAVDPGDALFSEVFNDARRNGVTFGSDGAFLPLSMFAAYFAFLFVSLRWWRLADYGRTARVSVWSVAWCGLVGYALSFFWWFPQPLGLEIAALIAFAVQLCSPWLPPSRRQQVAEQFA